MKKENDALEELALKLVINHITNSIENHDSATIKSILKKKFHHAAGNNKKYKKESRYILITGAGASHAVSNEIRRAPEAASWIMDQISANDNISSQLINKELNRVSQVYKLNKEDFESKLFAISRFFPDKVKSYLKELFNHKYEVGLLYEIIGHLLKHRFIDVVINYNFDEILDNIITEEIKSEDFKVIHADGQCPVDYQKDVIHKNNRGLKAPLYIKPHGTVSHPSTMRFTREDYYKISNEVNELIRNLFKGEHNQADYQYEVNLLVVGFGMKSFELNEIIKDAVKNGQKINWYFFDFNEKNKLEEELNKELLNELREEVKRISKKDLFKINHIHCNKPDSFDNNFLELWSKISEKYKKQFTPRDITRHKIIDKIFSEKKALLNSYNTKRQYFKDRTFVEIAISYLNSDGLLNLVQIKNSRVGKYFKLYQKERGSKILSSFLRNLDIHQYKNYVPDTFHIKNPADFFNDAKIAQRVYDVLLKNLKNKITQDRIRRHKKEIIENFIEIRKNNRLSVNYDENIRFHLKFENLISNNLIRNDLHWSFLFKDILKRKDEWDILLTVSEMGRFLSNDKNEGFLDEKYIEIITSSYDNPEMEQEHVILDKFKPKLISESILNLPWWLHNQHLVLFLKKLDSHTKDTFKHKFKATYGFYFTSRLLKRTVSPVFISDQKNLNKLFEIFINYWHKANMYKKDKGVQNFKDYSELVEQRKKFLKMCKKKMKESNKKPKKS